MYPPILGEKIDYFLEIFFISLLALSGITRRIFFIYIFHLYLIHLFQVLPQLCLPTFILVIFCNVQGVFFILIVFNCISLLFTDPVSSLSIRVLIFKISFFSLLAFLLFPSNCFFVFVFSLMSHYHPVTLPEFSEI